MEGNKIIVKRHDLNLIKDINPQSTKKSRIHPVESDSSSSNPVVLNYVPEGNKVRRTRSSKIIYPLIEECAELLDDEFWQTTFRYAASGKLPAGIKIKDNIIIFKKGRNTHQIEIPENKYEVLQLFMYIFKNICGLYSRRDLEERERNNPVNEEDTTETTWKSIKKKRVKKAMIDHYAHNLGSSLNLTKEEIHQLITLINMGFLLNILTDKHVKLEKEKIAKVEGIKFNESERVFEYINERATSTRKSSRANTIVYIDDKTYFSPRQKLISRNYKKFPFYKYWQIYLSNIIRTKKDEISWTSESKSHFDESSSISTPSSEHSSASSSSTSTPIGK